MESILSLPRVFRRAPAVARERRPRSREELVLWASCALLLLGVWALIIGATVERIHLNRQERAALAQSTAKGFSEFVRLHLQLVDLVLLDARHVLLSTGRLPGPDSLAGDLGPLAPMVLQMCATDAAGRIVASALPGSSATTLADHPQFVALRAAPRDNPLLSPPRDGCIQGRDALQLAHPIIGPGGEFRGIIAASIDPQQLRKYFASLDAFGEDASVAIAGRDDGIMRARFSASGVSWGQSIRRGPHWSMLTRLTSGSYPVKNSLDGSPRLISFHQVAAFPLIVFVTSKNPDWPFAETAPSVAIGIAFTVVLLQYSRARARRLREQEALIVQLTASREREAEANRMKSRFIASVSHELRTPLNAILGFSELLRDLPDHPENPRRASLIHASGMHLRALLDTVLDLAKIEAGRMQVDRAEIDLTETVRAACDLLRAGAQQKNLSLTFEPSLPADHRLVVDTDRTKLVQVLNNVLNNAIKFTASGGASVSLGAEQGAAVVRVEDTGSGIDAQHLPHVFDRFSSASRAGTNREAGTGLGLSLSRELMHLLGGSIDLSSRPAQGTQVTIRLPGARLVEVHA